MKMGCSGNGITIVTHNFCIYYTLHWVCMITSRCNQGAAAEADAIGEQQLKWV